MVDSEHVTLGPRVHFSITSCSILQIFKPNFSNCGCSFPIQWQFFTSTDKLISVLFDKWCIEITAPKNWILKYAFNKLNVCLKTDNVVLLESTIETINRITSIFSMDDHFRNHRIIESSNWIAFTDTSVNSYFSFVFIGKAWSSQHLDTACLR